MEMKIIKYMKIITKISIFIKVLIRILSIQDSLYKITM